MESSIFEEHRKVNNNLKETNRFFFLSKCQQLVKEIFKETGHDNFKQAIN